MYTVVTDLKMKIHQISKQMWTITWKNIKILFDKMFLQKCSKKCFVKKNYKTFKNLKDWSLFIRRETTMDGESLSVIYSTEEMNENSRIWASEIRWRIQGKTLPLSWVSRTLFQSCTQSYSRFSQTKWNNYIMKESFFSARKAFPMRSFTLYVTFFLLTLTYSMQERDQCNIK
jgi:hypothetical protein